MIDMKNMNKAEILRRLYNGSKPQGMGFLHYDAKDMSIDEAEELIKEQTYFDYLKGRVMKIDLIGEVLCTNLYNRDNGHGKAERLLSDMEGFKEIEE